MSSKFREPLAGPRVPNVIRNELSDERTPQLQFDEDSMIEEPHLLKSSNVSPEQDQNPDQPLRKHEHFQFQEEDKRRDEWRHVTL